MPGYEYKIINVHKTIMLKMWMQKYNNGTDGLIDIVDKIINLYHGITDWIGWFNSIAGVVKRRFASYVKLHLNPSDKEKESRTLERNRRDTTTNGDRLITNPFLNGTVANSSAASNQTGTAGIVCPSSPRLLSGIDRRHRSPDPPPRYVFILFCFITMFSYSDYN